VATRHVVDVDVPHPPVHRELPCLPCNDMGGFLQKLERVCRE
jgi:hypothetical protein